MQSVQSAGKHLAGTKRRKTDDHCQARENRQSVTKVGKVRIGFILVFFLVYIIIIFCESRLIGLIVYYSWQMDYCAHCLFSVWRFNRDLDFVRWAKASGIQPAEGTSCTGAGTRCVRLLGIFLFNGKDVVRKGTHRGMSCYCDQTSNIANCMKILITLASSGWKKSITHY